MEHISKLFHVNKLFQLAQTPVEEKDVQMFLKREGLDDDLTVLVNTRLLQMKQVGACRIYYPMPMVADNPTEIAKGDENLLVFLKKQLEIITARPTTEELKKNIEELKGKRDKLVLELWSRNSGSNSATEKVEPTPIIPAVKAEAKPEVALQIARLTHAKIDALHSLNDAKDETHRLLGILAELNQCTVKDMYKALRIEE